MVEHQTKAYCAMLTTGVCDKDARISALEAQNKLWQQNMREAYEAFSTMRNDLNELFPMQSAEADLLEGTEWSIACSAIVDAARNKFSTLEARLAEKVTGAMVERACRVHNVGWSLWKEPQKKTAREVMRLALTAAHEVSRQHESR